MSEIEVSVLAHCRLQWAVRMPDGKLFADPKDKPMDAGEYEQYEMNSFLARMFFGGLIDPTPPNPDSTGKVPRPKIFDTRTEADELLKQLQEKAAAVGVPHWGGAVVSRLCTPFTSGDPSAEFAQAVLAWAAKQQGAQA